MKEKLTMYWTWTPLFSVQVCRHTREGEREREISQPIILIKKLWTKGLQLLLSSIERSPGERGIIRASLFIFSCSGDSSKLRVPCLLNWRKVVFSLVALVLLFYHSLPSRWSFLWFEWMRNENACKRKESHIDSQYGRRNIVGKCT